MKHVIQCMLLGKAYSRVAEHVATASLQQDEDDTLDAALIQRSRTRRHGRPLMGSQGTGGEGVVGPDSQLEEASVLRQRSRTRQRAGRDALSYDLNGEHGGISPVISLNAEDHQCNLTGFSPLHAAIAIGLDDMVEWLLDLPDGAPGLLPWPEESRKFLRAKLSAVTGPVQDDELADMSIPRSLTPLQLAVFLGHKMVVSRILRRQMSKLWQWGPQSENHLFLDEIDSAAKGAHQVMDLVCRLDATLPTKSMLLDDFMGGFLFSLFEQKWRTTGIVSYS